MGNNMGNITKMVADDYSHGVIEFRCDNLDDIRKIGSIIDTIAFEMRFKDLNEKKEITVREIYKDMNYYLDQLYNCGERLKNFYDGKELPAYVEFIISQINENFVPFIKGFVSHAQMMDMLIKAEHEECEHKHLKVTALEIVCSDCKEKLECKDE